MASPPVPEEMYMVSRLTDAFARRFHYLHLSITDMCNSRCTYCPPDGYGPSGVTNKGFLTVNEICRAMCVFASLGTEEVRPTGGEPSLRHDFTDIIAAVRENDAIHQITVTINGYRLERDMANQRDAGLTSINVNVDSLGARQFHVITGQDKFNQVMVGIDAAFEAGFEKVKVNTVLMRDANHHQLDTFLNWIQHRPTQLCFVELMETNEGSEPFRKHRISGQVLHDEPLHRDRIHQLCQRSGDPAQVSHHPNYVGETGPIMPCKKDSCAACSRLRVPFIDKLHLCLFGEGGVNLHDLLEDGTQQQALEACILAAPWGRKQTRFLRQNNTGAVQNLPYIGG